MTRSAGWTTAVLMMTALLTSCARSDAYSPDDTYYGDQPRSYYNRSQKGETPTQAVDALGQPKKRVVVFKFWNDTPVQYRGLEDFAANELRRGLSLSQRVILPPQNDPKLNTEFFLKGDRIKVGQLIQEGRQLGVSVLVVGRVAKIVFRQRGDEVGLLRQKQSLAAVDLEIKVFDVASGREVTAVGRSGEASSNSIVALEGENLESQKFREELIQMAVRESSAQLVPKILQAIEKMAWQGRVAKLKGQNVYINAGRQSGLVVGDILKVLTPGDDVYDPQSGAYLGRTQGELKGTLEVKDFIGPDGAVAHIHSGGNIAEGDVVRLY